MGMSSLFSKMFNISFNLKDSFIQNGNFGIFMYEFAVDGF